MKIRVCVLSRGLLKVRKATVWEFERENGVNRFTLGGTLECVFTQEGKRD